MAFYLRACLADMVAPKCSYSFFNALGAEARFRVMIPGLLDGFCDGIQLLQAENHNISHAKQFQNFARKQNSISQCNTHHSW